MSSKIGTVCERTPVGLTDGNNTQVLGVDTDNVRCVCRGRTRSEMVSMRGLNGCSVTF